MLSVNMFVFLCRTLMSCFNFRISVNHALREFKAHVPWLKISSTNNLPVSVRYFYVTRTQYDQYNPDCMNNIVGGSADPLQLKNNQNRFSMSNLEFKEWQISDIRPSSVACFLIIVSVPSLSRTKLKRKRHQAYNKDFEASDSDTDNDLVVPEDEENRNNGTESKQLFIH